MAEDVYIQGFGEKGIPDFATEKTLSELVSVMSAAGIKGLKAKDLDKLVNAISNGDDKSISSLLKILKATESSEKTQKTVASVLNKQKDEIVKLREQNRKADAQDKRSASEMKESMDSFSGVMKEIQAGLKSGELGFGQAIEEGSNSLVSTFSGLTDTMAKTPWGRIGVAVKDLAVGVYGASSAINAFIMQAGEDRYNLANEIRQSGLATSLSSAQSGLVSFSEMVNRSSFTLGQAAEFTNKFSAAVGDAGIARSLDLVEKMAYGGSEGADMMRRFGLEFGGVANVAGQYLDTVKALGMLDRMDNQQLRGGMEDFMETVTVTSNIMKVNIQDAAEMIANTLNSRDDLTAMLATLPDDLRTRVDDVVGAMGAQNTVLGESLAMFLASGDMSNFMTTQTGQDLSGSQFGQQLLPLIESMGTQIQSGGDLGQIVANSQDALQAILQSAQDSGNSQLIVQGQDQLGQTLIAQISRTIGTIGDADAGNRADTRAAGLEDDRAFADRAMVRQEYELAMENISNGIANAANYAENLTYLNEKNLELIQGVEAISRAAVDKMGDEIADITVTVEGGLKGVAASILEFGNDIAGFISDDMAESIRIVEEQNRIGREMLGIAEAELAARQNNSVPEPTVVRTETEAAEHQQALDRQEREDYANGVLKGPVPEQYRDNREFNDLHAEYLLSAQSRDQQQQTLNDGAIQLTPLHPLVHMELPESFINEWNEKIRLEAATELVIANAIEGLGASVANNEPIVVNNDNDEPFVLQMEAQVAPAVNVDVEAPNAPVLPEQKDPIIVNDIAIEPPEAVVIDNTQIKIPEPVVINEETGAREVSDEPIVIERKEDIGQTGINFDEMLGSYLRTAGNMEEFISSVEGRLIQSDSDATNMIPLLQQIGDSILDQSSLIGEGNISRSAMLDSDPQLYQDFTNYQNAMADKIYSALTEEYEADGGISSNRTDRNHRTEASLEANLLAIGKFAEEINEGGYGQVSNVRVTELPAALQSLLNPEQETQDEPQVIPLNQSNSITDRDLQRNEHVNPEFIENAVNALVGNGAGAVEDFINQLGINNTDINFDLASERTVAQLAEFQNLAESLRSQDALSQERLIEILTEMQNTNTEYNSIFRSGRENTRLTERETSERDTLVATMRELIESLNRN